MIVRRLAALAPERTVEHPHWVSRRLLLRADGMGFSLHDTVLRAGTRTEMRYRNHLEAVYVLEGRGTLVDRESGATHALEPGVVYALDRHDAHAVVAETDLRMVCVFLPALVGPENHDAEGGYDLLDDDGRVVPTLR